MRNKLENIVVPVLSVTIALIAAAIVIMLLKKDPIEAYSYLFKGAFVGKNNFYKTLFKSTPLIFTGLSVMFAFKAGLFNIGGQGQMIMGGIAAVFVGSFMKNNIVNNIVVILLVSMIAGFLWAGVAGWLKAKLGVHEVISTIMLNYIAINFDRYFRNGPMKAGGKNGPSPVTPSISEFSRFPKYINDHGLFLIIFILLIVAGLLLYFYSSKITKSKSSIVENISIIIVSILVIIAMITLKVNPGFVVALYVTCIIWFLFEKTIIGYEIVAVGKNVTTSENAGIYTKFIILLSLGIAGLLAGLGGAERIIGGSTHYALVDGTMANYGFDGIAVALLGKNSPVGVVLAALLFGALSSGGESMQFNAGIQSEIIFIIQAIIIVFVAAENIFKFLFNKKVIK